MALVVARNWGSAREPGTTRRVSLEARASSTLSSAFPPNTNLAGQVVLNLARQSHQSEERISQKDLTFLSGQAILSV